LHGIFENIQMSIRFLNCGSIHPIFPPIKSGITCLLVETNKGLVLVDTGLGTGDYLNPGKLMRFFIATMRSGRDLQETAFYQIQRLGYPPSEVRHIIMTHLHLDHTGGLPDFPEAKVHLYHLEYKHIASGKSGWTYYNSHWDHGPDWVPHKLAGEKWFEFDAIRLDAFDPEIWLVPLVGHTPGHSGVAIRQQAGWVFHGGDAVPFNVDLDGIPDWISKLLLGPHIPKIRAFLKTHPEVKGVGAHMSPDSYERIKWFSR
jgi:glyoxylase-like metal-dependent hydrolase (beta-lactamase superfamily II)